MSKQLERSPEQLAAEALSQADKHQLALWSEAAHEAGFNDVTDWLMAVADRAAIEKSERDRMRARERRVEEQKRTRR